MSKTDKFQKTVQTHYQKYARVMPWRQNINPYFVVVSELMLQQTQVERVIPKFNSFIAKFPSFEALANAKFSDVLIEWNGLGYNRRARYLHQLSRAVVNEYNGQLPDSQELLVKLPGVGKNTAGAILAYAFNKPAVFIETNIRTVFIEHFFPDQEPIDDRLLLPLIEKSLDNVNPREWYWALMDYGAHLKKTRVNPSRRSKHYTRQSKFEGSNRQLRAKVLKRLMQGPVTKPLLDIEINDPRLEKVLADLENEHMITSVKGKFELPS